MKKSPNTGLIRRDEAYSKRMVLERLGISQKFWDKMIAEGLPYTVVGHTRWVTGEALITHLTRNAERKHDEKKRA
jgi:hypothetical protein